MAGGSSLKQLLDEHRPLAPPPPLTHAQILAWAEAHILVTGDLPDWTALTPVLDAPGETWRGIEHALQTGGRGLPKNGSLRRLLAGHMKGSKRTKLTVARIVGWAVAHHARRGKWPHRYSGPVEGVPGETWAAVNTALRQGLRGLPGRTSLGRLVRYQCVPRAKRQALQAGGHLETLAASSPEVNIAEEGVG